MSMRSFCDSWSSRSEPSTDVVAVAMVCLDWAEDGRDERLKEGGSKLIGESNKKVKGWPERKFQTFWLDEDSLSSLPFATTPSTLMKLPFDSLLIDNGF